MNLLFGLGGTTATSIPVDWANGLRARGHDVRVLASSAGPASFAIRLLNAVRHSRPDVVHLHHTIPALGILLLKTLRSQVRTVFTVHRVMPAMDGLARTAHLSGAICADAVVANSHTTLASFPRWLNHRSVVIYNGVDARRIDAAEARGRDPTPAAALRIVSVGRLIPEKGFDTLLRAIARLRHRDQRFVDLTIIGEGPERRRLIALTNALRLRNAVTFTGALERDEVYARLYRADLFALCSRTEGFCNAVVEAMATGLPVVVTPAGALPEVVGTDGFVASGLDGHHVAMAIGEAASAQPEVRRTIARAGAHRARTVFSIERTLDHYETLYARVSGIGDHSHEYRHRS